MRITARAVFAGALLPLAVLSCAPSGGAESPRRYIGAAELYAQGRFAETAAMLGGEKRFPPALTLRAKAEYFSGDLEEAEQSCRQAIRRRPSASEAKFYLARILREKGDFPGAEKTAEELLADNPHDIRALRLAAELAGADGKGDEAAALLDTAAELAVECAMVLLDSSRLRWIAGRGADALEDLGRARAMLPPGTPLLRSVERLESRIEEAAR